MEKIKIDMPLKYQIGISVHGKHGKISTVFDYKGLLEMLADFIGNGMKINGAEKILRKNGKAFISVPMLHSIAEFKVEIINNLFVSQSIPMKAFLESKGEE